ncbi:MAG: glycosyltransferase family 2 protein [Ardenticatenia bacterium]|nr:glycosyltransferase family 2 protein [Ardenticatenia bacterium]
MKLSIIIPVYNEEATLRELLHRVRSVRLDGVEKEVLVVDDGSTDNSRRILQEEAKRGDIRAFYHPVNRGKGAAIRTALDHVTGDIVLIQDADLEYDPRDYPVLIQPIIEGRADVVYGSRFLGGPRKAMLFWHMVGNKVLTFVTNVLYDTILSDMETCYKAFRTEVIKPLNLRSRRFEFEPEVTAKVLKRGIRIYEVPISYTGREYHEGKKITWKDGITALWTLIKYRFVD